MKIDITSMFFNSKIEGQTATPAWGTSIGQNQSRNCRIDDFKQEIVDMVIGMTYRSVADFDNLDVSKGSANRDIITCSVFENVFINDKRVENAQYVLLLVREHSKSHDGRLLITYAPYITYKGIANQSCIDKMQQLLGCNTEGCWFVYDISIKNQSDLYFSAVVVNASAPMVYSNKIKSKNRSEEWKALIPADRDTDTASQRYSSEPLQQIFYGAPGTGKSHKIKDDKSVKDAYKKNMVFRTTFHPDSDYSTFVGAYKPTMKSSERIYSPEELTIKLKEIKTTGTTYPCHKFAAKYWESLKDLTPDSIKQILNACGFTDNYSVEIGKGVAVGQEYLNNPEDGKIIYTFCPQTFTNAYVEAWNTEEEVYLVIEEINRGNCAQIFGDLFQLLDRKNGVSEYPVESDADLQSYLNKALAKTSRMDIPNDVKSGKKLILPSNLYIWATMNTSDQSLFPIDSAFKRRWEWKYIKIKEGRDENGDKLDWKVDVRLDDAVNLLPRWAFIQKINEIIASMTSSADKQLGYFFCKADEKANEDDKVCTIISTNTFVSKVLFYLWNDVFKDYGFEDASLFRYKETIDGKEMEKDLTFPDFYDEDGENVNTTRVVDFVQKVMNWKKTSEENN